VLQALLAAMPRPARCRNRRAGLATGLAKPALTIEQMTANMAPISKTVAEERVIPCVEDAIKKTLDFGIPYLSEFVKSRF
jgi:uncharacterized protein (DUF885 family)